MSEPDDHFVDETLDEHRGCMKLVGEVESCLDRQPDEPVEWTRRLTDRLHDLRGALEAHFASEEAGPMFRELPTRHPRLSTNIAKLEAEHPTMIEMLDRVLEHAGRLDDPEVFELRELNARCQLLIAMIRRHEAQENELVIQAHWDEVGVGD